jgi:hypothetical protein
MATRSGDVPFGNVTADSRILKTVSSADLGLAREPSAQPETYLAGLFPGSVSALMFGDGLPGAYCPLQSRRCEAIGDDLGRCGRSDCGDSHSSRPHRPGSQNCRRVLLGISHAATRRRGFVLRRERSSRWNLTRPSGSTLENSACSPSVAPPKASGRRHGRLRRANSIRSSAVTARDC